MDDEIKKPRGNYAPRGRRRQRITLDEEHAQMLHTLWLVHRGEEPGLTKTDLVEWLVKQAYREIPAAAALALLRENPPG